MLPGASVNLHRGAPSRPFLSSGVFTPRATDAECLVREDAWRARSACDCEDCENDDHYPASDRDWYVLKFELITYSNCSYRPKDRCGIPEISGPTQNETSQRRGNRDRQNRSRGLSKNCGAPTERLGNRSCVREHDHRGPSGIDPDRCYYV